MTSIRAGLATGFFLAIAGFVFATNSAPTPQPSPTSTTYDVFMRYSPAARRGTFGRLSPENRAEIMKTHMRRWLEANRARLNGEQKAAIAENLAALRAEFYQEPTSKEWRDKAIELFQKAQKLFSQDEMVQLFTLDGEYIPERK